jgi:rubrerythrin
MCPVSGENEIVEKLKEIELTVSVLYDVYSEKFKEQKDFWRGLALEEQDHARIIENLPSQAGDGKIFYNEKRFDMQFVEDSLEFVRRKIELAKNEDIRLKDALSTALHIEQKLTEKAFFAIFDGDKAALKDVFTRLDTETRNHRNKIKELLDKTT